LPPQKIKGIGASSPEGEIIDHINLILLGIHIHSRPPEACKFGNNIQRNKVIATILVKDTKSGRI